MGGISDTSSTSSQANLTPTALLQAQLHPHVLLHTSLDCFFLPEPLGLATDRSHYLEKYLALTVH